MARFNVTGADDLCLSLDELAEIPDEVLDEMLSAGADVVLQAMRRSLDSFGLVDSGQLKASLGKKKGINKKYGGIYYDVAPYGKRVDGERNGYVGYINEYGAPQRPHPLPAKPWMQMAVIDSVEEAGAAEAAVYDRWLESKK